jgi:hypothetical protein
VPTIARTDSRYPLTSGQNVAFAEKRGAAPQLHVEPGACGCRMHTSMGPATGESAGPGSAGRWRALTGPRSSTGAWTRTDITIGRRMVLDRAYRPSRARAGPTLAPLAFRERRHQRLWRLRHGGGLAADHGRWSPGLNPVLPVHEAPVPQVPGVTKGLSRKDPPSGQLPASP